MVRKGSISAKHNADDVVRLEASVDFVVNEVRDIIGRIDQTSLVQALEALEGARRVFLYGAGRSGLVARAFAVRLMHLGYSTYYVGETITAPVAQGDVVICISGSGDTYPVVMTAEIAKNIGATVISFTHNTTTGIARFSDIIVGLDAKRPGAEQSERAPLGTLFESAMWILLDGVVADLMVRTGQTEQAMRKRHATLE